MDAGPSVHSVDDSSDPVCISLDEGASPMEKLAFSQCDIYEKKGTNVYRVKCRVCGHHVSTSGQRLLYGHYLHEGGRGVKPCVTIDKLTHDYPLFMRDVQARSTTLKLKRK